MEKLNPFKPDYPIPPDMFAGRGEEINQFLRGIYHTKNNRPRHFLITGERGIGKSSLIQLYDFLAKGDIQLRTDDYGEFCFVTVNLTIEKNTDLATFVGLMMNEMANSLADIEIFRSVVDKIKELLYSLKIANSGIDRPERATHPAIVTNDFSHHLAKAARRISDAEAGEQARHGVVFFIDEADNAGPEMNLGSFIKTVTEKLQRNGCENVMFVLAGLPELTKTLRDSHPSSLRVFTMQEIKVLESEECDNVIDRAIEEGNRINKAQTTIAEDAKALISKSSEGYPHFIQQFGYSAYERNSNGIISADDVEDSIRQAIESIGMRYYEDAYRGQIQSDEYRKVLGIMAEHKDSWVKKSEIKAEFSGKEQNLSNALHVLTSRKIIMKDASRRGEYRLPQKAFAAWIKLFSQQNGKRKKTSR